MTRREAVALAAAALASPAAAQSGAPGTAAKFQIGCMTLPYAPFPLQRALQGIAAPDINMSAGARLTKNPARPARP